LRLEFRDIAIEARKVLKRFNKLGSLMRGEWPARWEPQEEGVMSIAARFPSV
jgi:hypothetical protein